MVNQDLFIKESPALYNTGKQIADAYRNELRAANAIGQGDLINFDYDVKMNDGSISLVYYLPSYWYFIENGRQPTVNGGSGEVFEKIKEWIQNKGIEPWVKYETKEGKKVMATLSDMTFAITKSIHNNGFFKPNHQGKHCLENSLRATETLQNEFSETAGRMLGKDFENFVVRLK